MFTIDTSVFVADQHPSEPGHAASRELILRLADAGTILTLPTLLLVELGGVLARAYGESERAKRAVRQLRAVDTIQWIALDADVALEGGDVAAQLGLRGADAVFVTVAHLYATQLVTLDKRQRDGATPFVVAWTPQDVLTALNDGRLVL